MAKANGAGGPVIIKKYANRRLYDTSTSSYVTLDHLSDLVRRGVDFEVRDAKTGEDLTRGVLSQIIFEQESKGSGSLPTSFLRQLIKFYGQNVQAMLPAWLDMSMNSFAESQEKWRGMMPATPMALFEAQARRNMEMFERAMRMFEPPKSAAPRQHRPNDAPQATEESDSPDDDTAGAAEALADLQAQVAAMQAQLSALARKNGK